MKMRFFITICLIFCGKLVAFPQQLILPPSLEEMIEEIAANAEEDVDLSVIIDDLYFLWENPLDLNRASREDLSRLYLLNDFQIDRLLAYVRRYSPVHTVYELIYIEGFTIELVRKISPFLSIGEKPPAAKLSLKNNLKYGRHQIYLRTQQVLEEQKGFSAISDSALTASPNSRYLGSPQKIYKRYLFSSGNRVFWGITAEKDAGEEFFRGSNKSGFDYYSAHFYIRDLGKIKRLALGDFHLRFGQGLVLWPGFSTGKSAEVLNIKKNPRGLIRYASTDENLFMRGAGTTISVTEKFDVTLFLSYKQIDASVSGIDSASNRITVVTSLQNTGLHATPSQVNNKNVLGEYIAGSNITLRGNQFSSGITAIYYKYSAPVIPAERIYNQFDFRGQENYNISADFQTSINNIQLFGEIALSQSGGSALLAGALANAGPRVTLASAFRRYSRDYHAYFSNAFGENTRNNNETGAYTGIVLLPLPLWKVSAFIDIFSFPWLKFGAYTPTKGYDYLVQADFSPSRNTSMYFRVKQKNKPLNSLNEEPYVRQTIEVRNTNFRYQINYRVLPTLELRNRIEFMIYQREYQSPEKGFLIYQDVIYRPENIPISLSCRYAMYETESYNARLYAYENDVLYAFSIPAYYDQGTRTYLNISYSLRKEIELWFRIAQTWLPHRETIGSDLNEIKGKTRTEAKLQLRFTF
jgi:hypothetical protein